MSANAYIPAGASVLESDDSELESADSSANSKSDPPKIGVWIQALRVWGNRTPKIGGQRMFQ